MARIRIPLNNFVYGEINPSLTSRIDAPVYNQAGQSVKNVFIRSEGGVINRPGTKRLFNFSQTYTKPTSTVTVSDYANIAVGTKLTFILGDGTKITLEFEASSGAAPSASVGNTHFVRANESNNTTADNIFTALNAISGLTVANPDAAVVSVTRDGTQIDNLSVTTTDSTRLTVTDFVIQQQQIRLEPFVFSSDEKYVVAFSVGQLDIFRVNTDGTFNSKVATITQDTDSDALPFSSTNLTQFTYAQQGDFMFIAHNDFMPLELVRTGLTSFEVRVFSFDTSVDGNKALQPYYNFQAASVTITPSHTSGSSRTLTTSAAYFVSGMVGSSILVNNTQCTITAVNSTTEAVVNILGTIETNLDFDSLNTTEGSDKVRVIMPDHGLASCISITISGAGALGGINNGNINGARTVSKIIDVNTFEYTAGGAASSTATGGGTPSVSSTAATTNWFEQSYSSYRGFPAAITFHENRLWFGGTPSQPSGLWASASGDFFNFDVGDGEDFDGLDLEVSVGVTNFIRHLFSNRDLQVFANQGEFFIPSFQDAPVTATNAKISEQTPIGSSFVRPLSLDGATLFVQATGSAIREYVFSDTEGAYVTNMASILSSHLISNPVQVTSVKGSLDRPGAYAFYLMDNGEVATFYSIRAEQRAGWTRWTTQGMFHSICAVDESLFCVTTRDDGSGTVKMFLEQFDKDLNMDFSDTFTGTAGVFSTSGHFNNGAVVDVVDSTEYLGLFTVGSNQVDTSLVKLSTEAQIGYKFVPELQTMPLDAGVPGGPLTGRPRKITNVVLDLNNTLSVSVNGTNMIIRNVTFDPSLPREAFTGKKEFRTLGYSKDPTVTISQIAPLNMQLNGMVVEVAFQ